MVPSVPTRRMRQRLLVSLGSFLSLAVQPGLSFRPSSFVPASSRPVWKSRPRPTTTTTTIPRTSLHNAFESSYEQRVFERDPAVFPSDELQRFEVSWEEVLIPKNDAANATESHPEITATDQWVIGGSMVSVVVLFAWLIAASGAGGWRFYTAGGICAALSHVIPVPIDVVKTRKQIDPNLATQTFWQSLLEIRKNEGLSALFLGISPTFWGYFFEGAIKFGIYEVLKPWIGAVVPSKWLSFVMSAGVSGLAAATMLCPMEALRIRMVAEPDYASKGLKNGALLMIKREGVAALGKGLVPMIYKQVPYTITKNVSFDLMTKVAYATLLRNGLSGTSSLVKFCVPFFSAAMASILSCISSQPGDMLLSLINAHEGERRTNDIVRDIIRSERGVAGFFVGIKTRFLHVGTTVTLQLLIYDLVKRFCGIAATGMVE